MEFEYFEWKYQQFWVYLNGSIARAENGILSSDSTIKL